MSTSITTEPREPRVAIVHDFLTYWGGAEQVLKSLHRLYPKAPIFTLLFDESMREFFPEADIRTSFLRRLPAFLRRRKSFLLPLFPIAVEKFDLSRYDLVISSSSSFAKGVVVRSKTLHIDYCHTPTRFFWDWSENYLNENGWARKLKFLVAPMVHLLRMWDRLAADRPDAYICNSETTRARLRKYYRQEAKVIYPPVDVERFSALQPDAKAPHDYYLIVSRLSPYKKVALAVEVFNKMGMKLVVAGTGAEEKKLRALAGPQVKILGFQSDAELEKLYKNCRAFIFPGEDDFGITMVEAMSCGKPVLAYQKGGALETVVSGVTGEFFASAVPEILADGVRRMEKNFITYDPAKIKAHAQQFARKRFEQEFREEVERLWGEANFLSSH